MTRSHCSREPRWEFARSSSTRCSMRRPMPGSAGSTASPLRMELWVSIEVGQRGWLCPHPSSSVLPLSTAGFQQIYLEPLLKFHISLKKLRLHEAEYVLLLAMLLFSPGRGRGGHGGLSLWPPADGHPLFHQTTPASPSEISLTSCRRRWLSRSRATSTTSTPCQRAGSHHGHHGHHVVPSSTCGPQLPWAILNAAHAPQCHTWSPTPWLIPNSTWSSPVPQVIPNTRRGPQCHVVILNATHGPQLHAVIPNITHGPQCHTPSPTPRSNPQCHTWSSKPRVAPNSMGHPQLHGSSPTPDVIPNATHHPQCSVVILNATRGLQLHVVIPNATQGPQCHTSSPTPQAVPKVSPNTTATPSRCSPAQVPLCQTPAAADGAADPEDGEHTADPPHPGPLQHDAAALRNHQLKDSEALSPHPRAHAGLHRTLQGRVKLFYFSWLCGCTL
uniref:NR LBD domain-containing protein n=1 Tax=Phasianus colchicus TaxID=9054 RepID=A0A669QNW6_PHACC